MKRRHPNTPETVRRSVSRELSVAPSFALSPTTAEAPSVMDSLIVLLLMVCCSCLVVLVILLDLAGRPCPPFTVSDSRNITTMLRDRLRVWVEAEWPGGISKDHVESFLVHYNNTSDELYTDVLGRLAPNPLTELFKHLASAARHGYDACTRAIY